jgi:hypothetical protein
MHLKSACLAILQLLVYFIPAFYLNNAYAQPAENQKVLIDVSGRAGGRRCEAERACLGELQKNRDHIEIRVHDIAIPAGSDLFKAVAVAAKLPWSLPITIVGIDVLQGFDTADTTGRQIENLLARNRGRPAQGFAALLAAEAARTKAGPHNNVLPENRTEPFYISLPGLGALDAAAWPLPAMAVVLGFLDGFNPCAMWVLITFLLVLMQLGSRRRMWAVAGLFIVAETLMYFLILNLWFKLWDFVGMDRVVTPAVGILAIGGGVFFVYEGWKSFGSEMACLVTNMEQRSVIVRRIKTLSSGDFGILAAASVIALAFSVNVIEFACSIGYPQAFTKIVELNRLGFWATEALIGVYTLFYMADDFLVFGLALWSFERLQLSQKYSRWTALGGGLLMLMLGLLMLFRPEALRVI